MKSSSTPNRSIEGVVKADDVDHLGVEVEEYTTNDAAKGVGPLLEEYTNYTNANGVWISGFFGLGKSHLLKMGNGAGYLTASGSAPREKRRRARCPAGHVRLLGDRNAHRKSGAAHRRRAGRARPRHAEVLGQIPQGDA